MHTVTTTVMRLLARPGFFSCSFIRRIARSDIDSWKLAAPVSARATLVMASPSLTSRSFARAPEPKETASCASMENTPVSARARALSSRGSARRVIQACRPGVRLTHAIHPLELVATSAPRGMPDRDELIQNAVASSALAAKVCAFSSTRRPAGSEAKIARMRHSDPACADRPRHVDASGAHARSCVASSTAGVPSQRARPSQSPRAPGESASQVYQRVRVMPR